MFTDYILEFSYQDRSALKHFIADANKIVLIDLLTNIGIFVNNLPPRPRVLVHLEFENETPDVQKWLKSLENAVRVYDINHTTLYKEAKEPGANKWNSFIGHMEPEEIDLLFVNP